jgi:hypothetical protein
MTRLPAQRVQCDRCLTVHVLAAKRSDQWGEELHDLGWTARPIRGGLDYRHACRMCAGELVDEFEKKVRWR